MSFGSSIPLRELAIGFFDGPHATPPESTEGPIFLRLDNITAEGRLDLSDLRLINPQDFPRWTRRVTPSPGDVVFSYEATLHRYAIIPEGFHGCLGRRLAIVRPNPQKVLSRYLHYYFLTERWRRDATPAMITGATVDRLSLLRIRELPIYLPSVGVQQRIVAVLSAYDDLVENNRRRCVLLEEAARHLCREWFIRLRFPGFEHSKTDGRVPRGWRSGTFGDLCDEVRETVAPEAMRADTPYIGLEHMPRRSISLSEWGYAEDVISSKHRYREGEIIFGKIRPYFHKVGIAFTDGVASSDAIVIRPREAKLLPLVLMTASSDPFVAATSQTMREGSKMPRADWKQMLAYPVPLPPDGLLQSFNDFINPILAQLKTLSLMNRRLKAARDLLLPRLMSGEVTV